jgi:hypothetical protein
VQPLLQWKNNENYTVCVFVAGIQHAMCACAILSSVICSAVQYFPRYLIKGNILGKKLLNIKCVFRVSPQLSSETFFILRNTERDIIKRNFGLHVKYLYSCPILMTLQLQLQRTFEKYSNNKFHENPSSGSELFHTERRTDGRTDRHDEANCRFPQIC